MSLRLRASLIASLVEGCEGCVDWELRPSCLPVKISLLTALMTGIAVKLFVLRWAVECHGTTEEPPAHRMVDFFA